MRRQDSSTLLGSTAAAWPLGVRAQQTMPVIGFLSSLIPGDGPCILAAFHRGLNGARYVEGRNVAIEIPLWRRANTAGCRRWRQDLVRRPVAMIVAISGGTPSALAATAAIPQNVFLLNHLRQACGAHVMMFKAAPGHWKTSIGNSGYRK